MLNPPITLVGLDRAYCKFGWLNFTIFEGTQGILRFKVWDTQRDKMIYRKLFRHEKNVATKAILKEFLKEGIKTFLESKEYVK